MTPKDKTDWQAVAYTLETMEGKVKDRKALQRARKVLRDRFDYGGGRSDPETHAPDHELLTALTVALKVMEEFEGMEKEVGRWKKLFGLEFTEKVNVEAELTALKQKYGEFVCPHGIKHFEHYCRECSLQIIAEEYVDIGKMEKENKELKQRMEKITVEGVRRIIIDKELIPTIAKDSGMAEWTVGESRKLAQSIVDEIRGGKE